MNHRSELLLLFPDGFSGTYLEIAHELLSKSLNPAFQKAVDELGFQVWAHRNVGKRLSEGGWIKVQREKRLDLYVRKRSAEVGKLIRPRNYEFVVGGKVARTPKNRSTRRENLHSRFAAQLFALDDHCALCGLPLQRVFFAQVDHFHALAEGGETVSGNLCLMHSECNASKGRRPMSEGRNSLVERGIITEKDAARGMQAESVHRAQTLHGIPQDYMEDLTSKQEAA